ncbi:uncharacterized protein LOC123531235 isoform X2 [Mercenaria mercenaria]|uniref:uncharacterized protein LOC123531235 isoform X2 n=1 Tax=Mercenaria mercenaria TaxID=6596 RepID=UPI00234F46F9|nr:uncharacterized protein LOC123531235 isoform X2 [Mercenaria mercenaria]
MIWRINVVCLMLVMFQVCKTIVPVRSRYSDRELREDTISICSESTCGKYIYGYISRQFPGLFYTREQIAIKRLQFSVARENYLKKQDVYLSEKLLGDGDSCCPTEILTFSNVTMENVFGIKKFIVHMPPKYQFIPHGFCLKSGKCGGSCVVEPVTQTLLTYNPTTATLEFDQFVVPGYCSCKAS